MLTNEDLQAIGSILRTEIGASETRMTAKIEESEARTKTELKTYIGEQIGESEARMTAKIEESEARMTAKIEESEARTKTELKTYINERIDESEARMTAKIEESEERTKTHMNTVIESQLMPAIRQIADGVLQVNDRLDRMEKRLDSVNKYLRIWGMHSHHPCYHENACNASIFMIAIKIPHITRTRVTGAKNKSGRRSSI